MHIFSPARPVGADAYKTNAFSYILKGPGRQWALFPEISLFGEMLEKVKKTGKRAILRFSMENDFLVRNRRNAQTQIIPKEY